MWNLIPGHKIPVRAREHRIDARGFSATSHVLALSLNEIWEAFQIGTTGRDATCERRLIEAGWKINPEGRMPAPVSGGN